MAETATTTRSRGHKRTELGAVRDTVESIWVAIVLAAVLRAFMFEAFVIPTGSMAPRLMGDHQDLVCACGYRYAFGMPRGYGGLSRSGMHAATGARCPSCGAPFKGTAQIDSGDRVLVLKYLYRFREPRPWEVVVFKNPQDNRENYIKRLVGTPGRMIEIVHGDVFYREGKDRNDDGVIDEKDFDFNGDGKTDSEDYKDPQGLNEFPWRICRKPARAQDAMWQVIFDNDYRPSEQWQRNGESPRWICSRGWQADKAGREFVFEGGGASPAALRFEADEDVFRPHYGYNTRNAEQNSIDPAVDICGDLKLSLVFMPKGADSQIALMTTSFDDQFRAELRADGSAGLLHRKLGRTDWTDGWPRTNIGTLRPGRNYQVALVHVDSCVELWVDGKRVLSSEETGYSDDRRAYSLLKDRLAGLGAGTVPAPQIAIEADGGGCELRHVRLHRDVYYTTPRLSDPPTGPAGHIARQQNVDKNDPGWGTTGNPIVLRRYLRNGDMDEFFMLGDNSPQSLDGRAWVAASPTLRPGYRLGTVPRYNLIGRALFVYWPAGFRPPGLPRLPILPNVGRMRLIR